MASRDPVKEALEDQERLLERHRLERQQAETELKLAKLKALAATERALSAKGKKPQTHLVIPDAHARPGYQNDRFTWVGRMIRDLRPDIVVCLGDFSDMESLCFIDQNSRSADMRSYPADVSCTHDALQRIRKGMGKYEPKGMVMLHGNHEQRIAKVANSRLPGTDGISIQDLGYKATGWHEVPYVGPGPGAITIDGCVYRHYLPRQANPRFAVGGTVNPGRAIFMAARGGGVPTIWGHSHKRQEFTATNGYGQRIRIVNAGLYSEEDMNYPGEDQELWERGLYVLRDVVRGTFEPEWWPIAKVREAYG